MSNQSNQPRYVYLDKYTRNKLKTDDLLDRLEQVQLNHVTKLRLNDKRLNKSRLLNRLSFILALTGATMGFIALIS